MRSRRTYKAIDLFAGAGGLTLGLKQAGFQVVAAIELNPVAVETYQRNHPEVQVWAKDIVRVSPSDVRRKTGLRPGDLDLLAGCPPCQGFSVIRTRNGARRIRDLRNDLVFQFLRFVRAFKPKAIMMENVPGLAVNRRMREFRSTLERMGYTGDCRVVDAADYGVPQRRRRMIFLASKGEPVKFARPWRKRRTVADALRGLPKPGRTGDELHDLGETRAPHVEELIRHIPKNGGSRTDAPARFQLPCHRRTEGFFDVYGRMAWHEVAPTITSGCHNPSKGRFLHPSQNRAITLREAALLQTFPRSYQFSLKRGKEQAALLIGNALPPAFIRRVAAPIRRVMERWSL